MLPRDRTLQLAAVLTLLASASAGERWSRQIANPTAEAINDWIPLTDPCPTCHTNDRSGNGRVLNFPQNQYTFSAPGTLPQTQSLLSVGQPFQFPRFVQQSSPQLQKQPNNRPQVNQHEAPPPPSAQKHPPASQSFFQFEMPAYQTNGGRQEAAPSIQTGYQIQHSLPHHQSLVTSPLFSQKPLFPPEFHPLQPQQQKLVQNKNVQQNSVGAKQNIKERPTEVKQTAVPDNYAAQPPPQYQTIPGFHSQEPTAFQAQLQYQPQLQYQQPTAPAPQNEEVQLLYVPYDTLLQHQNGQNNYKDGQYNVVQQHQVNPSQINSFYTPEPGTTPGPSSTTPSPSSTYRPTPTTTRHRFSSTTLKPKPKPHQPPLAIFALNRKDLNAEASVNDVLISLKNADSIAVIDTPTAKRIPPVFIGPSGLPAPNGFTKFALPYLSNLDRKSPLDDVPFFVAPASYRVPAGFVKIPLPEPHVGSVVVNSPFETNFIQGIDQITQRPTQRPLDLQSQSLSPLHHQAQFDQQQLYQEAQDQFNRQRQQEEQARFEHQERVRQQEKEEQLRLERQKEEQLRIQREKEEREEAIRLQKQRDEAIRLQKQREDEIRAQKQREDEIRLQQQREEEIRLQQQREEESRLQQQREEELHIQRQKEDEQRVQREREEQIRLQREKDEQARLQREKDEEIREQKRREESARFAQQQEEIRYHNHRYTQSKNNKQMYITPITENVVRYRTTTTRLPTSHTPSRHRYQFGTNVTPQQAEFYRDQFLQDITSARPGPTRPQHADRVRPVYHKRPDDAPVSTVRPYAHFKPMPNNVVNEEYFNALKVQPIISTPSSTPEPSPVYHSSSTASPSSSTESVEAVNEEVPTTDTYVEIQPSISQSFDEVSSSSPQSLDIDNYTVKPALPEYSKTEENHTPRAHHRGRQRPPNTTARPRYENVQYTPVSLDVENHFYNIPHSTQPFYDGSTLRTTTPRNSITYYTPSVQIEPEQPTPNTVSRDEVVHYSHSVPAQAHIGQQVSEYPTQETVTQEQISPVSSTERTRHIVSQTNFRNNEINDDKTPETEQEIEYDPNPYKLPSELPPLTPNLPGLVNGLQEKDKLNALEQEASTESLTTTTSTTLRPTRRPIQRGRRPNVTRTSTSVSYSTSVDSSTRRSVTRPRRPYYQQRESAATTISPTTTTRRTPIVRNPNRIRYTPTAEERQRYRSRTRGTSSSTKKKPKTEDNIEYQRDVLNQNYPVLKGRTTVTTTQSTPTTTSEKYIETTVSNIISSADENQKTEELFPGLLEPMQIAQEYHQNLQDNYGPGYFPNEEEVTTDSPYSKNEIHPVYTTTTEAPTRKRPSFARRLSRPTRTTTEAPEIQTTTVVNEEKYTIRPKIRPTRPKVVKIRGRIRKPHPASTAKTTTTTTPGPVIIDSYNQLNRFNQDFYQDNYSEESSNDPRTRSRFSLEPQESQWSPSLSDGGSFVPIDPSSKAKLLRDTDIFENEQEIVTAGPTISEGNTFLFNVSAGFGPTAGSKMNSTTSGTKQSQPKTSYAKKLDSGNEGNQLNTADQQPRRRGVWKRVRVRPAENFETAESQNLGKQLYNSIFNSEKEFGMRLTNQSDSEPNDKTPEMETTTVPNDMEDMATTTLMNDYEYDHESFYGGSTTLEPDYDATTMPPTDTVEGMETIDSKLLAFDELSPSNDSAPIDERQSAENEPEVTTMTSLNESSTNSTPINRRRDEEEEDLETQPSIFDEVRKQLTHIFSVEEEQEDDFKPLPRRQEYTSIQRIRTSSESAENKSTEASNSKHPVTTEVSPFHRNLMGSIVYATSTSTEVSHETEICYRGRCIKSSKPLA